mmetsp:Transcript_27483/g.82839  ORF Transcript_27483/g.82839 Transcript_27483/m.82839 type:complete len:291 (+) Transcript_27483:242-1114(+)
MDGRFGTRAGQGGTAVARKNGPSPKNAKRPTTPWLLSLDLGRLDHLELQRGALQRCDQFLGGHCLAVHGGDPITNADLGSFLLHRAVIADAANMQHLSVRRVIEVHAQGLVDLFHLNNVRFGALDGHRGFGLFGERVAQTLRRVADAVDLRDEIARADVHARRRAGVVLGDRRGRVAGEGLDVQRLRAQHVKGPAEGRPLGRPLEDHVEGRRLCLFRGRRRGRRRGLEDGLGLGLGRLGFKYHGLVRRRGLVRGRDRLDVHHRCGPGVLHATTKHPCRGETGHKAIRRAP